MEVAFGGRGGAALGSFRSSEPSEVARDVCKTHLLTCFYAHKVRLLQLVSGDGVRAILVDVLENKSPLVYVARLRRNDRVLRRLSRD